MALMLVYDGFQVDEAADYIGERDFHAGKKFY